MMMMKTTMKTTGLQEGNLPEAPEQRQGEDATWMMNFSMTMTEKTLKMSPEGGLEEKEVAGNLRQTRITTAKRRDQKGESQQRDAEEGHQKKTTMSLDAGGSARVLAADEMPTQTHQKSDLLDVQQRQNEAAMVGLLNVAYFI